MRLLHLRRLAPGVPTGQAGPRLIAFAGAAHGLLSPVETPGRHVLEHDSQPTRQRGWMVLLQNRAAEAVEPAYRRTRRTTAVASGPEHRRIADQRRPSQGLGMDLRGRAVSPSLPAAPAAPPTWPRTCSATAYDGVIHCDRAKMYWSFGRLQWCWAHLKRDFQALIDSRCTTKKRLGHDLMRPTRNCSHCGTKFATARFRIATFQRQMRPIRRKVDALLLRGYFNATDAWLLPGTVRTSRMALDLRRCRRHRADQQCGGACVASCRHLAEVVVRHAIGVGQSLRGAAC